MSFWIRSLNPPTRIYGAGSRLETSGIDLKEKRNTFQGGYGKLVTKGVEYFYDEEGNLVRKTEADGSTWEYSYYGNGMLRKVIRPNKSAVIFKYDGLGRRIEKCITKAGSEKVISFAENAPSMAEKLSQTEETWETIGGVRIRNNLIYEGRKKEIFTERLNSEIAYEEKKFDWGKLACNVLIGLAAVALTVATAGLAAAALGAAAATVGAVVIGGAISGTIAVGFMAVSDIVRGEVSDAKDYVLAGI